MSDAAGRARDLLADPPIGVEVWGPIVEGLLGELERTKTGRRHDVEIAKMSWRDMAAAAGVEWNDDNPSMVQDITETIACTRADLAKARTVIERARPALESLANVLAFSSRDWGQARDLAWLWGIIHGWDDEDHEEDSAMPDQARIHGWDDAEVARLRRLHAAYEAILADAEGSGQ